MDINELKKYIMTSSKEKEELFVDSKDVKDDSIIIDGEKQENFNQNLDSDKNINNSAKDYNSQKETTKDKNGMLEFTLVDDGNAYALTGIGGYTKTSLLVPTTYDGKPVVEIGEGAFNGAGFLENIIIPRSIIRVSAAAFENCDSMLVEENGVFYADNWVVDCVDDASFAQLVVKEGTVGIASEAFKKCKSLTSVVLPTTLCYIGEGAFSYCTALDDLKLPESLVDIGSFAFYGCSSLLEVSIPTRVRKMGESVFSDCKKLHTATLPNSMARIEAYTFSECESLANLTFSDNLLSVGEKAFLNCRALTEIIFGNSLKTIERGAFSGCEGLQRVVLPESGSLKRIEDKAFYSCEGLKIIFVPDSVEHMGYQVFSWCTSLTSYCQSKKKKIGWDKKWNEYSSKVVWKHNHSTKYSTCECGKIIPNPTSKGTSWLDKKDAKRFLPIQLISIFAPILLLALGYAIIAGGETWRRETWLPSVGFQNFFDDGFYGKGFSALIVSLVIVGILVLATIVVAIVISVRESDASIIGGLIGAGIFLGYPVVGIALIVVRALIAIIGSLLYFAMTPVGVLVTGALCIIAILILRKFTYKKTSRTKSIVGAAAIALISIAVFYFASINPTMILNLIQ